jgi:Bacterial regulatory proteins, luxR family
LFVSLMTVESHVRNMFFKLEVTSRVELARAVERCPRQPGGVARALVRLVCSAP